LGKAWLAGIGVLVLVVAVGAYVLFWPGGSPAPGPTTSNTPSAPVLPVEIRADDRVLGKADAPVTIVEYASLTCPHCAAFHNETLPKMKAEFIDKGLVRLVYRDFPLDRIAVQASLLAGCAAGDGYFALLAVLFRTQNAWRSAADPSAALLQVGRTAGLSDDKMKGCIADQAALDRIVAMQNEGTDKFGVNATPTLIINGVKLEGGLMFDDLNGEAGLATVIRKFLPEY